MEQNGTKTFPRMNVSANIRLNLPCILMALVHLKILIRPCVLHSIQNDIDTRNRQLHSTGNKRLFSTFLKVMNEHEIVLPLCVFMRIICRKRASICEISLIT